MVYDWGGKHDLCRQLWVDENKTMDEIVRFFKDNYKFEPSKRAFQVQFKRWDFPSKHKPSWKNADLVARVKQLWEANMGQREMLDTLSSEGFGVNIRSLMRLRAMNGWYMRVANGVDSYGCKAGEGGHQPKSTALISTGKRKRGSNSAQDASGLDLLVQGATESAAAAAAADADAAGSADSAAQGNNDQAMTATGFPGASADSAAHSLTRDDDLPGGQLDMDLGLDTSDSQTAPPKRTASAGVTSDRLAYLKANSDALLAAKKRRRRTRGWGVLPADPPAPPRFPSELSLDEAKAFLHLDNEGYTAVRNQFQEIFEATGCMKKTEAGPQKWQDAKDKLVGQNAHLNRQLHGPFDGVDGEKKALALDIICTDVTKRMRVATKTITVADAKNLLNLNPEEARRVRGEFYSILKENDFTSKTLVGEEFWAMMKQQWVDNSVPLQRAMAAGNSLAKEKAVNWLARDVMKRYRDDLRRANPEDKAAELPGPGPGPAWPGRLQRPASTASASIGRRAEPTAQQLPANSSAQATKSPATRKSKAQRMAGNAIQTGAAHGNGQSAGQIDPNLLGNAYSPDQGLDSLSLEAFQQFAASAASPLAQQQSPSQAQGAQSPSARGQPVWFRQVQNGEPSHPGLPVGLWLGVLAETTVEAVKQAAVGGAASAGGGGGGSPGSSAIAIRGIYGLVGGASMTIGDDEQLGAYLQYVASGGGAAGNGAAGPCTFLVEAA